MKAILSIIFFALVSLIFGTSVGYATGSPTLGTAVVVGMTALAFLPKPANVLGTNNMTYENLFGLGAASTQAQVPVLNNNQKILVSKIKEFSTDDQKANLKFRDQILYQAQTITGTGGVVEMFQRADDPQPGVSNFEKGGLVPLGINGLVTRIQLLLSEEADTVTSILDASNWESPATLKSAIAVNSEWELLVAGNVVAKGLTIQFTESSINAKEDVYNGHYTLRTPVFLKAQDSIQFIIRTPKGSTFTGTNKVYYAKAVFHMDATNSLK